MRVHGIRPRLVLVLGIALLASTSARAVCIVQGSEDALCPGDIVVTNVISNDVVRIDPTGQRAPFVIAADGTDGPLLSPQGVGVTVAGSVFVTDAVDTLVYRLDPATSTKHLVTDVAPLLGPTDLVPSRNADPFLTTLLVVDSFAAAVIDYDQVSGADDILVQSPLVGPVLFPQGIGLDPSGDIYVTDTANQVEAVYRLSRATGNPVAVAKQGSLENPQDVAYHPGFPVGSPAPDTDFLLVSDSTLGTIFEIDPRGDPETNQTTLVTTLNAPIGVTVLEAPLPGPSGVLGQPGDFLVADVLDDVVFLFECQTALSCGTLITSFNTMLDGPWRVAVVPELELPTPSDAMVVDSGSDQLLLVEPQPNDPFTADQTELDRTGGTGAYDQARGVAQDSGATAIVAEATDPARLLREDLDEELQLPGAVKSARDVIVTHDGSYLVVDDVGGAVHQVSRSGALIQTFRGLALEEPRAIALDEDGIAYVANRDPGLDECGVPDGVFIPVVKLNTETGTQGTLFLLGSFGFLELTNPLDITADTNGDLLVLNRTIDPGVCDLTGMPPVCIAGDLGAACAVDSDCDVTLEGDPSTGVWRFDRLSGEIRKSYSALLLDHAEGIAIDPTDRKLLVTTSADPIDPVTEPAALYRMDTTDGVPTQVALASGGWTLPTGVAVVEDPGLTLPGDPAVSDPDDDLIGVSRDNCPTLFNPDQRDTDGNGLGDACNRDEDQDGDEFADDLDNCPTIPNQGQFDFDNNGIGNDCDPGFDNDNDGTDNGTDTCPDTPNGPDLGLCIAGEFGTACVDDADCDEGLTLGTCAIDNTVGEVCNPAFDNDQDGAANGSDNCPNGPNPGQEDGDGDGHGDVCQPFDGDFDGITDIVLGLCESDVCSVGKVGESCFEDIDCNVFGFDNCAFRPNGPNEGSCFEGLYLTACGADSDCDVAGVCDTQQGTCTAGLVGDPCADDAACDWMVSAGACVTTQADADDDGVGDVCDNCQDVANSDQRDTNLDGIGNACDADYDDDGLVASSDFIILAGAFGLNECDAGYVAAADDDGQGIASSDFSLLAVQFNGEPGPGLPGCDGVQTDPSDICPLQ